MPSKVTSKIGWKSKEQKKRATKIAKEQAGSLSAHIQNIYDALTPPNEKCSTPHLPISPSVSGSAELRGW